MSTPVHVPSPELIEQIADLMAAGYSLKKIAEVPGMPSRDVFTKWMRRVPEFYDAVFKAATIRAFSFAEEIVEIADTESDPQRARNRIDARKWMAQMLDPKKYSPKTQVDLTIDDRTDYSAMVKAARERVIGSGQTASAAAQDPKALPEPQPNVIDVTPIIVQQAITVQQEQEDEWDPFK